MDYPFQVDTSGQMLIYTLLFNQRYFYFNCRRIEISNCFFNKLISSIIIELLLYFLFRFLTLFFQIFYFQLEKY